MAKVYTGKITKHTDWGGDESTGMLPVVGQRVQEFIRESLEKKAGCWHYDASNNRYIVFADEENRDAYLGNPAQTGLIIATFDAPTNYSAHLTLVSPAYVAILSGTKNNYIDFTFDTVNKSGQSVGEAVIATYTFMKSGTKRVVTEKYQPGASVHFKIDDYIGVGTNSITVGIVGQNTLAATTVGITYQVVDLQLSDTYDISRFYDLAANPAATAAIPYMVSGYGTKIMEWYLDGVLLEYIKVEDEIVDISTTRTKYISMANLSQGIHRLQYRTCTMLDGEKFYSDILYRDLIVVTGVDKNPVIAVAATIPVGNEILTSGNLQLSGITQYVPHELSFAVYNPSNVAYTDATIAVDGTRKATIQTINGEAAVYSLRSTEYGMKTLTVTAGSTVYTIGLNISKSSTSLEQITGALQLDLMSSGKSNKDADKEEWVYGLYSASFTGFNWNRTSGWNNDRLLVNAGAHVDINLTPLFPDPTAGGKTLEFEFATRNVSDDNAVICDLRNPSGTGLLITASEAVLKSAGGAEVGTKFKSEENIRIAFVINRKTGVAARGLAFVYVNGILSGAVNYSNTDNFTSDAMLRIGNTNLADVQLKALRFYDAALSPDEILNNYMLYRDTTNELLGIYDRNAVYEEGTQNFSVDKLAAQCPVFIFTGDIPALENTTDKKKTIYVDVEYTNLQDPSRSFTGKAIRLRPQGTSSMGYPKKNFRPYTGYGEVWDSLGNILADGLYAFKEGAQPVNVWCLKADYAESSGTHNTGIARLWNQVMTDAQVNGEYILRTQSQQAAIAAGYPYDVRTTVDGFPCHVLYRLTADSELVYIGKYNFNNDKSTESVFGFRDIPGFDNSRMQCWEVLNNGNHLALFQDMAGFDAEWDQAFEARYPDGSTDTADLKAFCGWVVSTKDNPEKFRTEKWEHLDVYKVAAYYVYLMRFGAVDQVVKNAMLTSEDGHRFFYINYDNDTIIGVRNDGLLVYNYDIDRQTVDTSFSALVYAYAGHDSTLWNNLEADGEFMRIVSEVDNALYMAGLSYEKVIEMFDRRQSGKWCERIYNQDAQYKYIGPYTDSGINNLFMLQGSRSAHRRWWLSRRFDLYDSKFISGAYKSRSIEFKAANAPAGLRFEIVAGNNYYAGYGLNNVPVETGIRLAGGEAHAFVTKQVINVGDPVRVYSATNVRELDLSDFIPYLSTLNIAEVHNSNAGTKLKKLVMGVDTTADGRRNTSLYAISGLSQAGRLEYLDIAGYQGINSLDLSAQVCLTTLRAYDSGLTGLVLADGSPVAVLELPDSMQSLRLDSLPDLSGGFNIKYFGRNLTDIYIRNCTKFDSESFIFKWNTVKLAACSACSIFIEGIDWKNTDAGSLIALGGIKSAGGMLSLKGKIRLKSLTNEQLADIKDLFGDNCTNPDNELYVSAPDGVFITGPSTILEGNSAQYGSSVFSDHIGTVEYYLVNGIAETLGYNGVTIDKQSGFVTTVESGNTRSVTVRAKHIPTQGINKRADMTVTVEKRTYPSSLAIEGESLITSIGDQRYALTVSPANITGEYTVEWALSGDAFARGLASLGSASQTGCIVTVLSLSDTLVGCTLTATAKKRSGTILATNTFNFSLLVPGIIMTSKSNPEAMAVCYEQGWAANKDYMTETEAANVFDVGWAFRGSGMTHFEEFAYFTGVMALEDSAFYGIESLVSISLPSSITSIGTTAFSNCRGLLSITLPESVTSIGERVFIGCDSLVSATLSKNLTSIGINIFNGCRSLASVVIPKGVTKIEVRMFYNCRALTSVILPAGITSIEEQAFAGCISLSSVSLLEGLTTIGYQAFSGCISLSSISLPEGLTMIGTYAFFGCVSLSSISLPEGLTTIESYVFERCISLSSIIYKRPSAPIINNIFGNKEEYYTGRNTYDKGINKLYVSAGATGYDTGFWLDPLQNPEKCGFTISYTL